MPRDYLPTVMRGIAIGAPTAIYMAVLYLGSIYLLWPHVQGSFGHSMFHHLEPVVMGATYTQGYSIITLLSLLAGFLAAYYGRADIRDGRMALLAGAFTGLVIASTFCLAAMSTFTVMLPTVPATGNLLLSIWYTVTSIATVLFVSLAVPVMFSVPAAAVGSFIGRYSFMGAGGRPAGKTLRLAAAVLLTVAGLVISAVMSTLISQNYDIPRAYPFLFSLPLAVTLPVIGAVGWSRRTLKSTPVLFIILGLSILAIVIVPMIGVIIACQTGLIYAPPYEWEALAP